MNPTSTIKSSSATFTLTALADFLSDKILKYATAKESVIIDPARGDGALLVSIAEKSITNLIDFELRSYETNIDYINHTGRHHTDSVL
jgi:hypothetical protein